MTCRDCPRPITYQSKTGRCRLCAIAHINATDPTIKQRRAEAWRRKVREPGMKEIRRAIGRRNALQALAWCPPAYRDQYQFYRRTKRLGKVHARSIVNEQIERDLGGITDPLARAILLSGLLA